MAKPSIRICQASIRERRAVSGGRRAPAARALTRAWPARCARSLHLDERWELQLADGEVLRPDVDLLAVLPLQHESGDVAGFRLQAVHVRVVFGLERDVSDRADVV